MFATKPISLESVPGALAKAERYRLLNEPEEAESICRDILDADPENHQALISLILALTDQIPDDPRAFTNAVSTIPGAIAFRRIPEPIHAGVTAFRRTHPAIASFDAG